MLKYGIICEFNPFHKGHKYLIEQTRKQTHADAVICIMSGSMVQRGDVAIFDKWTRAKAAVQNGADLVIELPVCYVLQSADNFALGAVEILNGLNADGISFGSEYADEELLKRIAEIKKSEPEEYKKTFKEYLKSLISLFITIIIFLLIFQIPFIKNYFFNNELIKIIINSFK